MHRSQIASLLLCALLAAVAATAAAMSHTLVVKRLIESRASVNSPDYKGRTPLLAAVGVGAIEVVEALCAAGANLALTADRGRCLLLTVSHLTPHTSLLTPHTSHLTPHTSHLTPHTSLLTPHTSRLTPRSSGMFGSSKSKVISIPVPR